MADEFKIVASLDIPISADGINTKDIPKLEKKLSRIKIKAELDPERSLNKIQSQLNTIVKKSKVPKIKVEIDTSDVKKAIKNVDSQLTNNSSKSNNKVQIFDSKQLDAEGRKYFTKATNIIDQVKNYYTRNGALSVDISSIEKSNGQIKSFTASVEESTGVIKKFNFERGKIDTGGAKPNYGFVQTDSLKSIDRNAGANLKSTLNFLTRIDEKIMSIQSKSTKQANPLKEGTVYYDNYNKKLSETVAKIEEIKSANKTLSIAQKNEIDKMVTELQLYAKEQQKLAYPPMISSTSVEDSVKKAQATLTTLEQKWKNQGILTGEFKTQVANLRAELDKVGNTEGLNKYNTSLKVVQENAKQLFSTQKEISTAITQLNSLQNSPTFTKNASNPQVTQTKQDINSLITAYQNLMTKLQGNITPAGLETVRTELTQLNARFNDATTTAKRFETELRNDNGAEKQAQRIALLKAQIEAYAKANPKAMKQFGDAFNNMITTLNSSPDKITVDRVAKQFQTLRQEINKADLAGKTFWQTFEEKSKKFIGWMSMTFLYSSMFRAFRSAITNVIELDKAMTNLKKVTDETDTAYAKFLNNASTQAKELHSTITDLVEQTAVWAKLGYSLNEAQNLATTSMIYSKVGEVENSKSVSDLVTVMKAFNIESEKSIRIVDSLNELGNNFATSAADLGEGLTKSASALQVANNSFEQSIALLTGGTEITQNANEMGSALKVISMRIRGMKGELEALGEEYDNIESISKIQTQILNLTKGKVNIFDDNGNFRATYDILKDISDVYNDLSDPAKADLTEILFGKMRGNQGVALIQAFQSGQIQKAYETALNSAGSAQKEFDSWSKSIEAHIETFRASFESLSKSLIKDNFLIGLVDSGTKLIDILDKIINDFGTIPTLIGGTALFAGLKNVGELLNTPVYAQPQLICA